LRKLLNGINQKIIYNFILKINYKKFKPNLVSNLFYQVCLTAISRLIGLFNSIYAVKTLGSYNIGLTNLIQTSVTQTSIIYDGGLNNVGIRKIVETNGENLEIGFQILSFRLFFGLLCSTFWITAILILKPQHSSIWYLGSIGIIISSLDFSFFFRAINKFNLFITLFSITPFITAIFYRTFLNSNTQTGLDYLIYIISSFCISLIILFYIIYNYGNPFRDFLDLKAFKMLFINHKHLWTSSAIGIIYPSLQVFTISYLLGLSQNGIYKASLIFIAPFELLNFLLSGTILPIITKWKELGINQFKSNIYKMFYNLILILLPFTIIVLLIPGNRITILIGDKYIYSIWVFKIALIGKIFILTFSPFYYTIIANRHDDLNLKLSILNSIVNILLCFTLIPILGIIGASLSMMACDLLISILSYIKFKKIKQINY
jgi:O-antigen/teichoic acid export membrane protein